MLCFRKVVAPLLAFSSVVAGRGSKQLLAGPCEFGVMPFD